jgi:hypothetical protein
MHRKSVSRILTISRFVIVLHSPMVRARTGLSFSPPERNAAKLRYCISHAGFSGPV